MAEADQRYAPQPGYMADGRNGYAWYVVILLMLVTILSYADRQAINFLAPLIQPDLAISETQMGLLIGPAFTLFYAIGGIPMGRIADRSSRRNLLTAGICVWSAGTVFCGLADGFGQLFVARAIVGIGEACLVPAAFSIVADYFPPIRRGKAVAAVNVGVALGGSMSLLAGGALLRSFDGGGSLPLIGERAPWELIFILFGLSGVIVALLTLTIREPARQGTLAASPATAGLGSFLKGHGRTLMVVLAPYIMVTFILATFAAWVPTMLVRLHGVTPAQAATFYGLVLLIGSSGAALCGGFLGDRMTAAGPHGRFRLVIFAGPVLLPAIALAALSPSLYVTGLGIILCTFFGSIIAHTAYAAVQDVAPAHVRGSTLAFYTLIAQLIGMGIGPALVAVVTQRVFADPKAIGWSLLVTLAIPWLIVLWGSVAGQKRFSEMRRAIDRG